MTKGVPFAPLVKVTGGADGPGRMQAVVDEDGEPVWQAGDIGTECFAISSVGWFSGTELLDSGWAWGQQYLNNTVAVAQANIGKGRVLLFGPEITFRGQPHSTFKFLFNGLQYGASSPVDLK